MIRKWIEKDVNSFDTLIGVRCTIIHAEKQLAERREPQEVLQYR